MGNLITRTKADGTIINYSYDDNNRLSQITYPDQSQVTYTYDAAGKRTAMTDPAGTTTYTYDELNRLKTVTRDGSTITYDYDTAGNLTEITYPDGTQVDYTYNDLNLLIEAFQGSNTMETDYDEGLRKNESMPNGVEVDYQYDDNERLTGIQHELGEDILAKSAYSLDTNGNRLTMTNETNQTTQYMYDVLGELTQVTYPDGKIAEYTYDEAGNRLSTEGDAEDKLADVTGTTNLSYDYEDRLIQFQDGSKTINYTYDGDGNLIRKTITESEETVEYEYLYDYSAGLPRLLVENKGSDSYNYLYAGRLYARKGDEGTVYYHQDGLGSTVAITDGTGAIKNKYTYDAFGNPTIVQEDVENSLLYTGELCDQSGYTYLRARYYDPASGRFITQDTVSGELDNPLTQNLYAYCGNNTVNYVDPSGHWVEMTVNGVKFNVHVDTTIWVSEDIGFYGPYAEIIAQGNGKTDSTWAILQLIFSVTRHKAGILIGMLLKLTLVKLMLSNA